MKFSDIKLRQLVPGLRVLNQDKSQGGTLKFALACHWYVLWDNGNQSVLGAFEPDELQTLTLYVSTRANQLIIAEGWTLPNPDEYTH